MYWIGDWPGGVMYGLVTTDQGESCTGLVTTDQGESCTGSHVGVGDY